MCAVLVLPAWMASQAAHIAFRYQSLGSLRFDFLNHRRACTLALAHVQGQPLPGDLIFCSAHGSKSDPMSWDQICSHACYLN